jgi:hypothetical protein
MLRDLNFVAIMCCQIPTQTCRHYPQDTSLLAGEQEATRHSGYDSDVQKSKLPYGELDPVRKIVVSALREEAIIITSPSSHE